MLEDANVREADYATYPKGLMYSIDVFDSWLYDENAPFVSLKQLAAYEELRRDVETGYFEKLIKENILANPHGVLVILAPEKGLSAQRAKEDADRLAAYKASLSDEEIRKITSLRRIQRRTLCAFRCCQGTISGKKPATSLT